ncbi:MAG: acyl-ACP thioesterase domain-containing protein [Bacteroidota bacterium]
MPPHPQLIYQAPLTVSTYEIDRFKNMTVPALINQMHEAAMQNVLLLKLSLWDLEPYKLSWVLMRLRLNVRRIPKLGEEISIRTHPAGFQKFFTYRDYRVFDADHQPIAEASSTWLLMDTEKRKMTRIPDFILQFDMPAPADCLPRISDKLPNMDQAEQGIDFRVNWHDLDFNQHLSNVNYFQWMLDALPEEWLLSHQLTTFDIQFRLEASLGDALRCEWKNGGEEQILHRLIRLSDGKELANARTVWKANSKQ